MIGLEFIHVGETDKNKKSHNKYAVIKVLSQHINSQVISHGEYDMLTNFYDLDCICDGQFEVIDRYEFEEDIKNGVYKLKL